MKHTGVKKHSQSHTFYYVCQPSRDHEYAHETNNLPNTLEGLFDSIAVSRKQHRIANIGQFHSPYHPNTKFLLHPLSFHPMDNMSVSQNLKPISYSCDFPFITEVQLTSHRWRNPKEEMNVRLTVPVSLCYLYTASNLNHHMNLRTTFLPIHNIL